MGHGRDAPQELGSKFNQPSFNKAGTGIAYISNTGYSRTFELTTVELLNGGLEVSSRLEFDEASTSIACQLIFSEKAMEANQLTPFRHGHGRFRSRRHQLQTVGRNLSDPKEGQGVSRIPAG